MSRDFRRLRLMLTAMPLLAWVYEAYAVASPDLEHQQIIAWLTTFVNKLALRLPLALILAIVVYSVVSVLGAVLFAATSRVRRGSSCKEGAITSAYPARALAHDARVICSAWGGSNRGRLP